MLLIPPFGFVLALFNLPQAARQERMLDELHGESVRMLENNHRLAMRVIHQVKSISARSTWLYHRALDLSSPQTSMMDE